MGVVLMSAMLRLKLCKDLELVYDAPQGLSMEVYTDVAADTQGALALATTLEFPATVGKQTYTLPLDGVYATLVRFRATSDGRVILYAGILRVLDIGTSFFGQNGEIWDSLPMNIGS